MNRTLNNMVRAMLAQANMPNSFWAEAMNTATYLKNRLPNSAIDHTNDGVESLCKRGILNFSSHLAALSGIMSPKKTGKSNVATSSWTDWHPVQFAAVRLGSTHDFRGF